MTKSYTSAHSKHMQTTNCNPRKEYWRSHGSNQRPLVLKSATLPTELCGEKFSVAFAEDKINVTKILKFFLPMVENILGKGANAGYPPGRGQN